ncbi:MAG: hypothetical protein JO353_03555 [Phycisphaerae bacterium]|nr:hypothetical protein [Phycisphaerae bacterium]
MVRWSGRFRVGVPVKSQLDFFGDTQTEKVFWTALDRLRELGGQTVEIDFQPFQQAARLLYSGPWLAERSLAPADLLARDPDAVHPITRQILTAGQSLTAADAFKGLHELAKCRQLTAEQWQKMDVLFVPTAGTIYTIDQISADPLRLNANLGRYTNFVNLLDLCAVAVPAGFTTAGLPVGVSLIAPADHDDVVLALADRMHRAAETGSGMARTPLHPPIPSPSPQKPTARIAVVGAHLSGLPFNHQLTDLGASLVAASRTAPIYRLFALPGTVPPKPGMVRVDSDGASIELEVWELPLESFGRFVTAIPSPLGIGNIKLIDGSFVQGFLCESFAVAGARDISSFGGWRSYLKSI